MLSICSPSNSKDEGQTWQKESHCLLLGSIIFSVPIDTLKWIMAMSVLSATSQLISKKYGYIIKNGIRDLRGKVYTKIQKKKKEKLLLVENWLFFFWYKV